MRYASIRSMDISNGAEIGVALFVQGCHFHCENCFNKETWDFNGGKEFTEEVMFQFSELIREPYIKRVSILGGEPLAEENVDCVYRILFVLNFVFPDKKIWLYTGYTYEDILKDKDRMNCLKLCDVLVDGQYDQSLKDYKHRYAGSTNQRVIDVKSSLKENKVILAYNQ